MSRDGSYDPSAHKGRLVAQSFQRATPDVFKVDVEGEDESSVLLRVLVNLGVRSVLQADPHSVAEHEDDDAHEEVIFTLEATFAVEYFVLDNPSKEDFLGFVDFNCVHNVWPFWREHVLSTLRQASLPIPAVPLFAGRGSAKKKKIAKIGAVE
ncbi:hypothetical protein I5W35_03965 [Stenotrophomonas maltophilia]|nr:hypothetical protein [Stenotrophomonas maltophilia]